MTNRILERKDVDVALTWDLTSLFKTEEDFINAITEADALGSEIEVDFKGKLSSPDLINQCLNRLKLLYERIHQISNYSYLSLSVDQLNSDAQARNMKTTNFLSRLESRLSFVRSEIIQAEESIIDSAIEASAGNSNYLKEIKRFKQHTLHPEVERVLSALSGTMSTPFTIYNRAKLADMDFGTLQ